MSLPRSPFRATSVFNLRHSSIFFIPASISILILSPSTVITWVGDPAAAAFLMKKLKPIEI
jgi:hypothetical protein